MKEILLLGLALLVSTNSVSAFSSNPDDIHFWLYTDPNAQPEEIRLGDSSSIPAAGYDNQKPAVFIFHGGNTAYHDYTTDPFVIQLKTEYLKQGSSNVIGVDYSKLVSVDPSPAGIGQAVLEVTLNVQITGKRVADFIQFLQQTAGLDLTRAHLLGWSLGAQVAGVTGAEVRKLSGGSQVGRISGLDPMGLTFGNQVRQPDQRLDPSDATFVDVTYTSSSNSLTPLNPPVGHVNFYPNANNGKGNNGDFSQPGCPWNWANLIGTFWCSHAKAYQYFANTINGPSVEACRCTNQDLTDCKQSINDCPNKLVYGEYVPKSANGIYHLSVQA